MTNAVFGSEVWNSPANVSIVGVKGLEYRVNDDDNQKLNSPLNGVAINPIRIFPNAPDVVVWGARTCEGSSDDHRYIAVRRTMQMLKRDISYILMPYVFAANDATTWMSVQNDVNAYLTDLWKMGALIGGKPSDAFSVQIGLGITMTGQDILLGNMILAVSVSVAHPAEFQEMTFIQLVQR